MRARLAAAAPSLSVASTPHSELILLLSVPVCRNQLGLRLPTPRGCRCSPGLPSQPRVCSRTEPSSSSSRSNLALRWPRWRAPRWWSLAARCRPFKGPPLDCRVQFLLIVNFLVVQQASGPARGDAASAYCGPRAERREKHVQRSAWWSGRRHFQHRLPAAAGLELRRAQQSAHCMCVSMRGSVGLRGVSPWSK